MRHGESNPNRISQFRKPMNECASTGPTQREKFKPSETAGTKRFMALVWRWSQNLKLASIRQEFDARNEKRGRFEAGLPPDPRAPKTLSKTAIIPARLRLAANTSSDDASLSAVWPLHISFQKVWVGQTHYAIEIRQYVWIGRLE